MPVYLGVAILYSAPEMVYIASRAHMCEMQSDMSFAFQLPDTAPFKKQM